MSFLKKAAHLEQIEESNKNGGGCLVLIFFFIGLILIFGSNTVRVWVLIVGAGTLVFMKLNGFSFSNKSRTINKVKQDGPVIRFRIQGSAQEPYEVTFKRNGSNISGLCTCPAGMKGQYCKHRFRILLGETRGIVEGNLSDVETIASWLPGSDVQKAAEEIDRLSKDPYASLRNMSDAKKKLAKALRDS